MKQPVILIIEAELAVREPVSDYLRECGYRVVERVSTDEAQDFLARGGVPVDIVLADAESTGAMGGFAFGRWVKSNHPRIQVLLAGSVEKVAEEAGNLCAQGPHLARPYHHQVLGNRIRQMLAHRRGQRDAS
ncbi:MAG: response regulator [bacterium]|nr:response regulator [bacterium]